MTTHDFPFRGGLDGAGEGPESPKFGWRYLLQPVDQLDAVAPSFESDVDRCSWSSRSRFRRVPHNMLNFGGYKRNSTFGMKIICCLVRWGSNTGLGSVSWTHGFLWQEEGDVNRALYTSALAEWFCKAGWASLQVWPVMQWRLQHVSIQFDQELNANKDIIGTWTHVYASR